MLPPPPLPRGAEQYGAWWDEPAAAAATAFFPTYLRHTEGEWLLSTARFSCGSAYRRNTCTHGSSPSSTCSSSASLVGTPSWVAQIGGPT